MSEFHNRKQDVDFLRKEIQQQQLGPYDSTPLQPLELDLSQEATRISYELAVNLFLQEQNSPNGGANETLEREIADFTSPEVAQMISRSALQDVRELNDL